MDEDGLDLNVLGDQRIVCTSRELNDKGCESAVEREAKAKRTRHDFRNAMSFPLLSTPMMILVCAAVLLSFFFYATLVNNRAPCFPAAAKRAMLVLDHTQMVVQLRDPWPSGGLFLLGAADHPIIRPKTLSCQRRLKASLLAASMPGYYRDTRLHGLEYSFLSHTLLTLRVSPLTEACPTLTLACQLYVSKKVAVQTRIFKSASSRTYVTGQSSRPTIYEAFIRYHPHPT